MTRIERLVDVAMDEVHLSTPVSAAAIAGLKLGDVVYVSGVVYTAREGRTIKCWTRASRSPPACASCPT